MRQKRRVEEEGRMMGCNVEVEVVGSWGFGSPHRADPLALDPFGVTEASLEGCCLNHRSPRPMGSRSVGHFGAEPLAERVLPQGGLVDLPSKSLEREYSAARYSEIVADCSGERRGSASSSGYVRLNRTQTACALTIGPHSIWTNSAAPRLCDVTSLANSTNEARETR